MPSSVRFSILSIHFYVLSVYPLASLLHSESHQIQYHRCDRLIPLTLYLVVLASLQNSNTLILSVYFRQPLVVRKSQTREYPWVSLMKPTRRGDTPIPSTIQVTTHILRTVVIGRLPPLGT